MTNDADATDKVIETVDFKLDNLDKVDEANEIVEAAEVDYSDKAIESDNTDEVKEAIAHDEANNVDDEISAANGSIMINKVVLGLLALFECDQGSTCSLRN